MADQSEDEISNYGDAGDYNSEFDYDSEVERKRAQRSDLAKPEGKKKVKVAHRLEASEEFSRDEGRKDRYHLLSMDAYARHKKFINDYLLFYGGSMKVFERDKSRDRTDHDVIREHHQFLWSDDDDNDQNSWERRLAKKYYDKLFKEYCIGDLSRYKENKVALRWRIESEVVSGKGQFICGEKRCNETEDLRSWEVNFVYMEQGIKKNALVKIRLCPECSKRLNYHHRKREIKASKRKSDGTIDVPAKLSKNDKEEEESASSAIKNAACSSSAVSESTSTSSSDVTASTAAEEKEENVWAKPQPTEEVSREEEFDNYFMDMFL